MSETLAAEPTTGDAQTPARDAARPQAAYGFAPAMVSALAPNEAQAEAIRTLRTHIMAQHAAQGRRALAVCAPSAGVGCSFIAANLAVALSQIGVKTLLVDADLRHPALERMVRPPRAPEGLAHCLVSADTPFSAAIDGSVLPNLSLLYAGPAATNSQELLAGDRFRALMNYCLREFDMTIVDTPPANTSSDARRICGVAGYALIVSARDKTAVRDVKVLAEQLRTDKAVVIGTVLNRA